MTIKVTVSDKIFNFFYLFIKKLKIVFCVIFGGRNFGSSLIFGICFRKSIGSSVVVFDPTDFHVQTKTVETFSRIY